MKYLITILLTLWATALWAQDFPRPPGQTVPEASEIPYDNTVSSMSSLNVQDAIDELNTSAGGGGSISETWTYNATGNCLGGGTPGTGEILATDPLLEDAQILCLDKTPVGGSDLSLIMPLVRAGDIVIIQRQGDSSYAAAWIMNATPFDNGTYWIVGGQYIGAGANGNTQQDGEKSVVGFLMQGGRTPAVPTGSNFYFYASPNCSVAPETASWAVDDADHTAATTFCIYNTDTDNNPWHIHLYPTIRPGDRIVLHSQDDTKKFHIYDVNSAGTNRGQYWDWDVAHFEEGDSGAGGPSDDETYRVSFWMNPGVDGATPNTLAYIDSNEQILSSACTVDPSEATGISCAPLNATGQGLTLCEAGTNGTDCMSISLGTNDIPDTSLTTGRDGRFPAAHARPQTCIQQAQEPMVDWDTGEYSSTKGMGFIGTVPVSGSFDTSGLPITCNCTTTTGYNGTTFWSDDCYSMVILEMCDTSASPKQHWSACGAGINADPRRIQMLLGCTQDGWVYDPDGVVGLKDMTGHCSNDSTILCTKNDEGTTCGGGNECLFEVFAGDPWWVRNGTTMTNAICTTDRTACDNSTDVTNCEAGGGTCVSGMTLCTGGSEDGNECSTVAERDACNTGGGSCAASGFSGLQVVCYGGTAHATDITTGLSIDTCVDGGGVAKWGWQGDVNGLGFCGELW